MIIKLKEINWIENKITLLVITPESVPGSANYYERITQAEMSLSDIKEIVREAGFEPK